MIRRPSKQFAIYLAGVVVLGFFYERLKAAAPNPWVFVAGAVCYLICLRLVGARLDR